MDYEVNIKAVVVCVSMSQDSVILRYRALLNTKLFNFNRLFQEGIHLVQF
jgi:hypothetical protein